MAVKASRYLTHIRRLRDPAEPVGPAARRGRRAGPAARPGAAATAADPGRRPAGCWTPAWPSSAAAARTASTGPVRVAVEPRHPSWWCEARRGRSASAHQAALCWADRLGHPVTPLWRTADWGYLRFHEGAAQPWPCYGPQALRTWAARLRDTWPGRADVYAYFNNDPGGAAVARFGRSSPPLARTAAPTRTPTPGSVPLTPPVPTW